MIPVLLFFFVAFFLSQKLPVSIVRRCCQSAIAIWPLPVGRCPSPLPVNIVHHCPSPLPVAHCRCLSAVACRLLPVSHFLEVWECNWPLPVVHCPLAIAHHRCLLAVARHRCQSPLPVNAVHHCPSPLPFGCCLSAISRKCGNVIDFLVVVY